MADSIHKLYYVTLLLMEMHQVLLTASFLADSGALLETTFAERADIPVKFIACQGVAALLRSD